MSKRKKIYAGIAAVLVIAAVAAAIVGYRNYRVYHETYILIDETEYRRDSEALDLSGQSLTELEKVKELTGLKRLDLRGTGITALQYEDIQAALPDCEITWSVPFQNGYVDSTIEILPLDRLADEDIAVLEYFPNLSRISAGRCRDYDALFQLMEQRPDLAVSYSITLGGQDYYNNYQTLTLRDPDVDEILENLKYLPGIQTVSLTGDLPANETLQKLADAYPEITFVWDFEVLGISVNTLTEFLDLSGIKMDSTEELEDALPYFRNLTQVDMVDCGISNEEMDALNKRHEETKFVWKVSVGGMNIRTDAKYFMPAKYHLKGVSSRNCANLKYCEDMLVLDFGHYGLSNVDFIKYMPNLKYLLLCEANITDLTTIGNCTSLEFLEFFMTPATDFWPLTNLTNLRDLNISRTSYNQETESTSTMGDITPLLQMTWLDRLWMASCNLTSSQKTTIQQALPETTLVFESSGCTTSGFRYTPRYYQQRDILGMYYSHN